MEYIYKQYIAMVDAMFDLQLFADGGTNVIGTAANVNAYTGVQMAQSAEHNMTATMKKYYDTELLENARNEHYYDQFGKKAQLPRGRGKKMEWRRFNTLPNADRLVEGVIPKGKNFGMTMIEGEIHQFGMYITISDQLELHAVDDIILGATEELGASAGESEDVMVRNVLMEGTNVIYAPPIGEDGKPGQKPVGRWGLTAACRLTPELVNETVTMLKKMKAPRIDGKYVALIHPSVAHDLRSSAYWIEVHKYSATAEIFNGEIGELHGVRFIETPTAIVWKGAPLTGTTPYLNLTATYVTNDNTMFAVYGDTSPYKATIAETPAREHVGRYVHIYDASESANVATAKIIGVDPANKYVWFDADIGITPASGDRLYPGESGAADSDGNSTAVYGCLFLGKDAYGILDPDGAAMEMIIKDKAQAGGPLNQFSTLGYKFSGGAKILYQDRMIRVECGSALGDTDEDNSAPLQQADPVQQG